VSDEEKGARDSIWGTVKEEELAATYRERDALAVSWEEAKAERDALRAEVERLREALREVEDLALLEIHPESGPRTVCRFCGRPFLPKHYNDCPVSVARAALSSTPPAKASAVDEALAAWRGLSEEQREAATREDWHCVCGPGDDVCGWCVARDLLRAAAVKP